MKKSSFKTLLVSGIFFCCLPLAAQEESQTGPEPEYEDPETCVPFPSCALRILETTEASEKEKSAWAKLWEEITKELNESASNAQFPNE
jgi:hypothetical protein